MRPESEGDIVTEITHRTVKTNGINIHIAEAGEGPLVLMLHGFPELWYSYRHQLPALAEAGYHAVASDVRGYGQSDRPEPIEAYSMKNMVADAVGIVEALGEDTAVIIGHDWGGPMAWNSAALWPERFRAVVGLSVPFVRRSAFPPTKIFKQIFQNNFFYMLYFQEPGVAEAEFEADVRHSMKLFMFAASGEARNHPSGFGSAFANKPKDSKLFEGVPEPDALPAWLTEADLDYYSKNFQRSGFRGGLNRYRNMDRDWEELPELAEATITQPALFIAGEYDGVIAMTNPESMKPFVPNLRKSVILPGCGHWTQQERPAEVNAEIIDFLNSL
jgi:pimeloyl-ACP methyl ester carboxylesterase